VDEPHIAKDTGHAGKEVVEEGQEWNKPKDELGELARRSKHLRRASPGMLGPIHRFPSSLLVVSAVPTHGLLFGGEWGAKKNIELQNCQLGWGDIYRASLTQRF